MKHDTEIDDDRDNSRRQFSMSVQRHFDWLRLPETERLDQVKENLHALSVSKQQA